MPVIKDNDFSESEHVENLKRNSMVRFSQQDFSKLVLSDLTSTSSGRSVIKNYKQSEVRELINTYKSEKSQNELVSISETLYVRSPHYRRLLEYYAGMPTMAYVITPTKRLDLEDKDTLVNAYYEIAELVGQMNIKHEFRKIIEEAFKSDVFFGYVYSTEDDFYIKKLNNSICKISSVEYGTYNFSIDMTFFEKDEKKLVYYPKEIISKFNKWKRMKANGRGKTTISKWVELDAKNTICIKINEGILETVPPFAGSFDAIFDIDGFKTLRKDKEELGNYMLLAQRLPIRTNTQENNDFAIDLDMMQYFHNTVAETTPENVGVITSPMEVEPIRFDRDKLDNDGVAKAERDFWSGSGTSQALFSTENNTSQGITMSIKTDEQLIFLILNQIERWINRYVSLNTMFDFYKVELLPVTYFSLESLYKTYLEASTYGLPLKLHVASVLGLEPIQVMGLTFLENDVFELHTKFMPLASSHTMSTDSIVSGETGRPTNEKSGNIDSDETARADDKPDAKAP